MTTLGPIFLAVLGGSGAPILAAQKPQEWSAAEKVLFCRTFRVTMTTRLVIPTNLIPAVDQLQISHALPTLQPWSNLPEGSPGASDIAFSPLDGKTGAGPNPNATQISWRIENPKPGQELKFVSSFTVRSARRTFDPFDAHCEWPTIASPATVNTELAKLADMYRYRYSPTVTVLEFCKWISANLTYDASVPYGPGEAEQTMANRRGHCGHFYAVLEQLCRRVGLRCRPVWGLDLYDQYGSDGLMQKTRADWTNIHTWAAVEFPGIGWVELDPGLGDAAFTLPATYIQNNSMIQNYSAFTTIAGVRRRISWQYEDGQFHSRYQLSNVIEFSELPG